VKVVLIGYRCTGKSAAGRRLANRLGAAFVDTDERVEAEADGTVAEIVRAEGWAGFRRRESAVLQGLGEDEACVVATGGGVVLDPRNREILKSLGLVVWLDATPEAVARRMDADAGSREKRPGLTDLEPEAEVRSLLREREPLYRQAADIRIDTTDIGIDDVVEEICRRIDPHAR
jgi:shikimate kinase